MVGTMIKPNYVKAPRTKTHAKREEPKEKKPRILRPKVYAVDFDGTLSFGRYPNIGKPNTELIEALKYLRNIGCKVILWTTREGQRLDEAVEWCDIYGLRFDAVNDNLPELVEVYGNPRKVAADLYISSKSFPYWSNGEKGDICRLLQNA